MTRWLAPLATLACAACLYDYDFDPGGSERVSCTANWDCDQNDCGTVLVQPHTNELGDPVPCPGDSEDGWIGVEDDENVVRFGGPPDDQDAVNFLCLFETRYFPVCADGALVCGGVDCPPGPHACGIFAEGMDPQPHCVATEGMGQDCADTGDCVSGQMCIRFIKFADGGSAHEQRCVDGAAIP